MMQDFKVFKEIEASVVMKQNMVAIFGEIMPEPLDIAPMVTSLPPIFVLTAICLGTRSVVIIAFAMFIECVSLSPRRAEDLLMPDFTFAIGR